MTLDEMDRFRKLAEELGLEEKDILEKIEKPAKIEMIDRGWEAQYRYWGLGGATRGDATDDDLKADAGRHGLTYDPDDISNILEAYQSEYELLIWNNLEKLRQ